MEQVEEKNEGMKMMVWIIAGVLVVALLTGAAFMAGRMMQKQTTFTDDDFLLEQFKEAGLPEKAPITNGTVTALDGDTLTVQEFGMADSVGMEGAEGVEVVEIELAEGEDWEDFDFTDFIGEAGPSYEVVITYETKIYKDVTTFEIMDSNNPDMIDNMTDEEFEAMYSNEDFEDAIEFKIEESTANEIGKNSMVTVWGEKKGDRIIATVILFQPMMDFSDMDFETP